MLYLNLKEFSCQPPVKTVLGGGEIEKEGSEKHREVSVEFGCAVPGLAELSIQVAHAGWQDSSLHAQGKGLCQAKNQSPAIITGWVTAH